MQRKRELQARDSPEFMICRVLCVRCVVSGETRKQSLNHSIFCLIGSDRWLYSPLILQTKKLSLVKRSGLSLSWYRQNQRLGLPNLLMSIHCSLQYVRLKPSLWGLKIGSKLQEITLMWRKKHRNFITCVWGKEDVVHKMSKTLFKRRE